MKNTILHKYPDSSSKLLLLWCWFFTVHDWDSMCCPKTQTRGLAFQTLSQAFQILDRALSFLLIPQKLSRVFQKFG